MDFQKRMILTTSIITDFLRQYQRPTHLDDQGALREISMIAEEVNNLVSTSHDPEGFRGRIETALRYIRRSYTQRTWPTPAHFVKAMEATVVSSKPIEGGTEGGTLDPIKINAKRIKAREAVGDSWLWGRNAKMLLASRLVTIDDLTEHRDIFFKGLSDVYGADRASEMLDQMNARHDAA
jgi:hypothetical protein